MIVKIWPVKGARGLKKAILYVNDDNKITKIDTGDDGVTHRRTVIDTLEEFRQNPDSYFIENEENIERVLTYMTNGDKVKNKYVSGYLCDPERALADFEEIWSTVMEIAGKGERARNTARENMAFHLVQSFPEDVDIPDEEVHQCGIELLQKLKKHQGIVCSHVHPVVDEEGEVHGRCKHNHILFNAYMMPNMIDPKYPHRVKYNDCRASYEQLRVWNDEIAIDHGLPIIRYSDLERVYSWKENAETKQGNSWKERVRLDIESARRITGNWNEFVDCMQKLGYQIRDGAHVTYTAPDGVHKVRGGKLGMAYTKESLELYWTIRHRVEISVERAMKDNEAPPLWSAARQYGPLVVKIPLGTKMQDAQPSYPLPLDQAERTREVLSTYFSDSDIYDVQDASGRVVASATGRELIDYLDDLRRGEDKRWMQKRQEQEKVEQQHQWQREENARRQRESDRKKRENCYDYRFRNSRTRRYYRTNLWDENGRRRTSLELIFLLAVVVIRSESGLWDCKGQIPAGKENEAVFGSTDWKVQSMIDAIHIAAQEGLESPEQLEQRLHDTGAAYSRARAGLAKTKHAQEKMKALADAIEDFIDAGELVERILALEEGPEKARMLDQYRVEIRRYKKAQSVMYGYHVTTPEQIADFQQRYADIQANLPVMQERLDGLKEEYRQLKKLQYSVSLAQNAQFCYGPAYEPENELALGVPASQRPEI